MKNIKLLVAALSLTFLISLNVSAQNIVFTSLNGDKIDVEAQKDKVVVLAIGASWLPLSNDQANTINKLAKKYAGRNDIIFYFIATDSTSKKSKNYASDDNIRKFVKTKQA